MRGVVVATVRAALGAVNVTPAPLVKHQGGTLLARDQYLRELVPKNSRPGSSSRLSQLFKDHFQESRLRPKIAVTTQHNTLDVNSCASEPSATEMETY